MLSVDPAGVVYKQTPRMEEWRLVMRAGSGEFIVSRRETLLVRIDRASGLLCFWDKKGNREVSIPILDLWEIAFRV